MRAADLAWGVLLFAATALYVTAQPPNLGPADESVYLYQAKRVLEGALPYRDVFDLTTPGWLYVMAALFRLFGVSLATARTATAVLHGASAVMAYATCRRLGVRPSLAWPAGVAYLLICPPAWPIASQHWLASTLSVLLLLGCAGLPGQRARWAFWPGVLVGAVVAVHQQRGVFTGAAVALWLLSDHLLRRRDASAPPPLLAQLAWLAAGAAAVLAPLFAWLIASAGFEPVWYALVVHPLYSYRSTMHTTWGAAGAPMEDAASYTFPVLLSWLPLVLLPGLLRMGAGVVRGERTIELRRLALLLIFGVGAVASIGYYPDFVHIAFIAPIFLIAAAELAESARRRWPARSPALVAAGGLAGAALIAGSVLRLTDNLARLRASYPYERDTAFGRVRFALPVEAELYDRLREQLDGAPNREIFCYPIFSYLYLMLDADNPTRYQFLLRGYTTPDQLREVVEVLEARRPPYVVVLPGFLRPDDPIMAYVRREYVPLSDSDPAGQAIYRRKSPPTAS